jgi:hypothetical protein
MTETSFDGLTAAEIQAYIFRHYGEDGLRQLLAAIDSPEFLAEIDSDLRCFKGYDRESLEAEAAELLEAGLLEAAAIVAEVATETLPEREVLCPYEPTDTANYERWQASYDRRQHRKLNPRGGQ